MRVLITGGGGQLAQDLVLLCRDRGDEVVAPTSSELDVTDRAGVLAAVVATAPDVVVNTAAWTAVDACESDPDRAFAVNALGPRWVAHAARRAGAHLVHVSTDYVFAGTKTGLHTEWDETGPRSVYGRSKLAGEREVGEALPGATVVRTSWLGGIHGSNMVKTVLGLRDRMELAFVDDQRGSPSFTDDVARAIRLLAVDRTPGLFHAANPGQVTWFDFVRDILAAAGADPGIVRPISTAELDPPRAAPRPVNSALDNLALRVAGYPELPHYRDALARTVRTLLG